MRVKGPLKGVGETVEGARPDRIDDLVLVTKISVGSHWADPQCSRELAQGHRFYSVLSELLLRRCAEAGAEISDVSF
jgi:hypothetical protein